MRILSPPTFFEGGVARERFGPLRGGEALSARARSCSFLYHGPFLFHHMRSSSSLSQEEQRKAYEEVQRELASDFADSSETRRGARAGIRTSHHRMTTRARSASGAGGRRVACLTTVSPTFSFSRSFRRSLSFARSLFLFLSDAFFFCLLFLFFFLVRFLSFAHNSPPSRQHAHTVSFTLCLSLLFICLSLCLCLSLLHRLLYTLTLTVSLKNASSLSPFLSRSLPLPLHLRSHLLSLIISLTRFLFLRIDPLSFTLSFFLFSLSLLLFSLLLPLSLSLSFYFYFLYPCRKCFSTCLRV